MKPVGNFTESPGGVGRPNIERWAALVNEERRLITERTVAHGGVLPPVPGAAQVLAVDVGHPRLRYVVLADGMVMRADAGRRRPQWLPVARIVEGAE
jgi:hypothetical protein